MKNFADNINNNWDWLKKNLGDDDWDKFLADSQKAINQFNINKEFSTFEQSLADSLRKTNKVSNFLGLKMATNEAESSKPEDLVQNSVNELAEKIAEEKTKPKDSKTN